MSGLYQETGEASAAMASETVENLRQKMPKVAKCSIVADGAVVAKLSRRVGVMTLRAKGFTW
jgi:hypothetical protein